MKYLMIWVLCFSSILCQAEETKKVLISKVVEHPALDKTTQGIVDALQEGGYTKGKNLELRIEAAQANGALAAQIANKFVYQNPDVVVGVGTVSAQSFAKYASEGKVSLAFSSVTDPLLAALVDSLEKPGNHTSGVSNFVPLEPQLELIQELQPGLKRLGILYNPGEINSVGIVKKLEKLCDEEGITLVKQTVNKTADVAQSAVKLAGSVQAILISNDNTALSCLQMILKAAQGQKIPVYVSDTDAVAMGALAALGPNQYEVGKQTGRMIVKALQGEDLGSLPVEFPDKTELFLNLEAAKELDISISNDLKQKAIQLL